MASMRDIKRRRSSIQGTQQITKAMKLVSTVKLQRARAAAEKSQYYFDSMYRTVGSILSRVGHIEHRYLTPGDSERKAVVVITSNRGLAGGYNSNVVKLITRNDALKKEDLDVYTIGNKGREVFARHGYTIREDLPDIIEDPLYSEVNELTARLLKSYENGEVGEIYLAYTFFKNTVSQEPRLLKLLPVEPLDQDGDGFVDSVMNFEPEDVEAIDMIIPKYISSLIYGGLKEAIASENGARMQAMDNATSNAEEMIDKLSLQYNRARQGSITQELTEIIAGSEAIG
ncbi:MAG: ATP synthase F1 subunit gamma [Lachnospiraceae bacterium]|jgi:F-type H+-transporting ATPase subunit gamma|nr:ATP synthase F1 subunit gamma [Lachnospiraceae bacterium]